MNVKVEFTFSSVEELNAVIDAVRKRLDDTQRSIDYYVERLAKGEEQAKFQTENYEANCITRDHLERFLGGAS